MAYTIFNAALSIQVLNAHVIKQLDTPMMVQNMVLYGFGIVLNLWAFMLSYNGLLFGSSDVGFFEGYMNIFAIAVVLLSGLIGVIMTVLYKYGDAIIKCFAQVIASVVLVLVSVLFFGQEASVKGLGGCMVVFTASYLYLILGPELEKKIEPRDSSSPPSQQSDDEDDADIESAVIEKEGLLKRSTEASKL